MTLDTMFTDLAIGVGIFMMIFILTAGPLALILIIKVFLEEFFW